jgi:hypothetical protein
MKGKHLPTGGSLVLTKTVLSGMVMYIMCFFETFSGVILTLLEYLCTRFYWQDGVYNLKGYSLAKILCRKKGKGPGIQDLNVHTIVLFSKWFLKLLSKDDIWRDVRIK